MIRPLLCQLYFRRIFLIWFNISFSLIFVSVLICYFNIVSCFFLFVHPYLYYCSFRY
ncbi:hypothetical protein HanIR_Chr01g0034891 [Helianthus annuus]|nr:hypothetical protein HanIR_Chr01g0034891 [Helianthus annuus]